MKKEQPLEKACQEIKKKLGKSFKVSKELFHLYEGNFLDFVLFQAKPDGRDKKDVEKKTGGKKDKKSKPDYSKEGSFGDKDWGKAHDGRIDQLHVWQAQKAKPHYLPIPKKPPKLTCADYYIQVWDIQGKPCPPKGGFGQLVAKAENKGLAEAKKLKCPKTCSFKKVDIVHRLWHCTPWKGGGNPQAIVTLRIQCTKPAKPKKGIKPKVSG